MISFHAFKNLDFARLTVEVENIGHSMSGLEKDEFFAVEADLPWDTYNVQDLKTIDTHKEKKNALKFVRARSLNQAEIARFFERESSDKGERAILIFATREEAENGHV